MSSPQFTKRTHPARAALEWAMRGFPWLATSAEAARQRIDWPEHIYCTGAAYAVASAHTVQAEAPPEVRQAIYQAGRERFAIANDMFLALATWRMTQGIYRIDPALYPALINTPIDDVPTDLLQRLPEWCIYIETPELQLHGLTMQDTRQILGAWVRHDIGSQGEPLLGITLHTAEPIDGLYPTQHLFLNQPTLETMIEASIHAWYKAGGSTLPEATAQSNATRWAAPILNCLLYICTQSAEITGKHGTPANPAPKKTRRDGWRLFAADGIKTWDVGVRIGAALRQAYAAAESQGGTHDGPRPHIRRAHWHGFRSGAMKRPDGTEIPAHQRKFELRWLPPIPVNVQDVADLPAVIRKV